MLSGDAALPAVRVGLRSPIDDVRRLCTAALDHLVDEDSFPTLTAMLNDREPQVRIEALHALAYDRCKDNACGPDAAEVLGPAITLLLRDPDRHVRAQACEVVGRWVHSHEKAVEALNHAKSNDFAPTVRKKASWYAPGRTIYRKTQPKTRSRA